MKKISIILSAALLAATFALAGCSNVTELNGSEWDTYKAGASGKSLADAKKADEAEAKAKAEAVTLKLTETTFSDGKYNATFAVTAKAPASITVKLASKASADVAEGTKTLTFTAANGKTFVYKNAKIAKDAETATFNYDLSSTGTNELSLGGNGVLKGAIIDGSIN